MKIEEYNSLDQASRDELLKLKGKLILNYVQGETVCDLYQLFDFFVLSSYGVRDNSFPILQAFTSHDKLKLFQDQREFDSL